MNKPSILLTGATGFLGSKILNALSKEKYSIILLKRSTSSLWRINHLTNNIKSYDIDKKPLERVFKDQKIDYVIHTACEYGRNNELILKVLESNLMLGLKILDNCMRFNTKTFINTDTFLQKNLNDYSLSKKQFAEWLKHKSNLIQIINLKIELMYGPKDDSNKLIPSVLSKLDLNSPEIKLTNGEQKRDFIYVDDVVSACITALENAPSLPKFNEFEVGTGKSIKLKLFLDQLKKIYELKFGKTNTDFLYGAIANRDEELMDIQINNKPLIELGWLPKVDTELGLKKILKGKVLE